MSFSRIHLKAQPSSHSAGQSFSVSTPDVSRLIKAVGRLALVKGLHHVNARQSAVRHPEQRPSPEHSNDKHCVMRGPYSNPLFKECISQLGWDASLFVLQHGQVFSEAFFFALQHALLLKKQKPIAWQLGFYAPPGYAHWSKDV